MRFILVIVLMLAQAVMPALAQSKQKSAGPRQALIRDAEIEGLLRLYSKSIFKVAGLNPAAVKVYVIGDPRINAFVAGGQRIFVHTGLFTRTKTPNEVIGVLAHETGHITGGHLSRMKRELESASVQSIVGMLLGAAAVVGGAAAGSGEAAKAGQGIMIGSQGLAQRGFLTYQRSMEASADQAAVKFLKASGQSAKGMLTLFQLLANESLASAQNADPYLMSHPMPLDRIRNLEKAAKASEFYEKKDPEALQLRHDLVKAKIAGFLTRPQEVFQKYPKSDTSLPARYARAIVLMRRGDLKNAVPQMDRLIADVPQNPYFWELKGQALSESGRFKEALPAIRRARQLLPNNGLFQLMEAEALVGLGDKNSVDAALKVLALARRTEADTPRVHKIAAQAYGIKGDFGRAELATAEFAVQVGDRSLAREKALRAMKLFKEGTPEWLRASDIEQLASRKN